MNDKRQTLNNLLVPILSVLMGFLIGAIIMLVFNFNPIEGYSAMFKGAFGTPFYIGETLRQTAPLIMTALGFALANIAGFFNIGVAGQALLGWTGSVWFAISFPSLPSPILLPLSILAGVLAGALWAGIAGFLRAFFGVSEVIVTIMLNHTSLYTVNYLIRNVMTDSNDSTPRIPEAASLRMEWLTDLTNNSTLHAGIFISLIMAFLVWVLIKKTTTGYEIRAVGLNPMASKYAGMSTKRTIIVSMLLSGALAGLGGAMEGLGNFQNVFVQGAVPTLGFDGLAVALLGLSNPIGIIFAALLFGALKIGGSSMPLAVGVPSEVVDIVIAFIIFFVGANYVIRFFLERNKKKTAGPIEKHDSDKASGTPESLSGTEKADKKEDKE
ncbi:ABC transporter permease [Lacticigenium naphthae]|uniref:ABC transporter permease n=1 Tax=Lacticigenium naphthae TaxID=515351 RepID=UPI00041C540D|nr:ABC transporter permease [Lacticigenium naphthae]